MILDDLIPDPRYRMRHARDIRAAAADVWDALHSVTVSALPLTWALEGLRLVPARVARRSPPPLAGRTFLDITPIPVLSADRPHAVVSGGLTQAWRIAGGATPPALDAASLRAWSEPGWVKVAMDFRLQPTDHGTRLSTETRMRATDQHSGRAFARYWWIIRPAAGAIRSEVLRGVARRAEAGVDSV